MASSRSSLLQDVKRKRADREVQRQREEDVAARTRIENEAAVCIQRVARGSLVRQRWSDEEWQSLQKQVRDLDKLAQMVQQKGQVFVAPCRIILQMMVRSLWQQRRAAEDLAMICAMLASFVAASLWAPLEDQQKSLCAAFGVEAPPYAPEPCYTLRRFIQLLLAAVTAAKGAAGVCKLADILDIRAWGQGRALDESVACRGFGALLLASSAFAGLKSRPPGLQNWRAAIAAAISIWPGGNATVPERLRGLVGVAASWLRLADGMDGDTAELVETIAGVPRISQLLAPAQGGSSGLPPSWGRLLRCFAKSLERSAGEKGGDGGISPSKNGSAKMLGREYTLAYASGNLWELHATVGLPLEPLLLVQATLTNCLEVSMLSAASVGVDEPVAVQALRQQLGSLVEPAAVARLFSQVLHLSSAPAAPSSRHAELLQQATRAYQRHCLAVVFHEVSSSAVESLCRIYSTVLLKARAAIRAARGGGWGPQVFFGLANTIAYMENGDVARVLWRYLQGFHGSCAAAGQQLQTQTCHHVLHLQATVLSQLLSVMSDEELRGDDSPLREQDLAEYVSTTTRLAAQLVWCAADDAALRGPLTDALLEQLSQVLSQLKTFGGRLPNPPPPATWHAPSEILQEFRVIMDRATVARDASKVTGPAERLLRFLPHSVPFEQRVALLRLWTQAVRDRAQGLPKVKLQVRRTHLFEDGLVNLTGVDWHAHFQVVFVNALGRPEQGQDAGGLFKEFLETLAETSFNPDYGLFSATDRRLLFPSPEAHKYHEGAERLFEFLGLVIGKAIFEGIVVEPCFALFFIAKLLGRHNSYYDLQSLDPALFANLQRLKGYDGNVADLCCSFVATNADGNEVPLLPNGQNVVVTNENRFKYVYLLSNHKLNVELKAPSAAFLRGFQRLIDERWLRMFGEDELQQVISGSGGSDVDLEDLRQNMNLSNCSGSKDRLIVDFFSALKAMKPKQHMLLLRFVTSCSRVPLLGFKHLQPPFTVCKVPIRSDAEKLPTSSTCFNTLKLPTYSSWKVMKQKLEFVIEQGAGFELD